jgi:hypothetical protein
MAWAHRHWYLGAFLVAEAFWILLLQLLLRARKGQPDLVPGVREPIRGWRLVEVLLVFYHFPMVLVSNSLGKKAGSPWVIYGVTPVLYSAIVYGFSRWGS